MITDNDRREVARRLRGIDAERLDRMYGMDGDGGECTDPDMSKAGRGLMLGAIAEAVGLHYAPYYFNAAPLRDRLADLIDPTCEVHRDTVLYPATDISPEHEELVFRCDRCGAVVSYDAGYDPETDAPAYCEICGSRITGIGEPWDE